MRDDNTMSNYFIAIEILSNLRVIFELNNHFEGSCRKLDYVNTEIEFLVILKRN